MDPLTVALIMLAISAVLTVVLMPKPQTPKPAALDEWEFPQANDGTPEAVIFGDAWAEGPMVLWYGNYRTKKIKSEGKK